MHRVVDERLSRTKPQGSSQSLQRTVTAHYVNRTLVTVNLRDKPCRLPDVVQHTTDATSAPCSRIPVNLNPGNLLRFRSSFGTGTADVTDSPSSVRKESSKIGSQAKRATCDIAVPRMAGDHDMSTGPAVVRPGHDQPGDPAAVVSFEFTPEISGSTVETSVFRLVRLSDRCNGSLNTIPTTIVTIRALTGSPLNC